MGSSPLRANALARRLFLAAIAPFLAGGPLLTDAAANAVRRSDGGARRSPARNLPYQLVGIIVKRKTRLLKQGRPCRAEIDGAGSPLTGFWSADRRHHIVDDRVDFGARNAGAGADRQRMNRRRRHARESLGISG